MARSADPPQEGEGQAFVVVCVFETFQNFCCQAAAHARATQRLVDLDMAKHHPIALP